MISDIKNRLIFGDIFFANDSYFYACDPEYKFKNCLNNPERADIFGIRIEFSYDPFDDL